MNTIIAGNDAVICSTFLIASHLLTFLFQVQQALAAPGTLERFVKDAKTAAEIRKVFTGLYALDLVSDDRRL